MYLLGYDIGSSSIKAALVDSETRTTLGVVRSPGSEMEISSPKEGWAEQQPEMWWRHVCLATKKLLQLTGADPARINGIGIAYQMHGLVLVDKDKKVLRPAIIWCDSRAVETGQRALKEIGRKTCLSHLLNAPGNFTASKLKWVQENEPAIYDKVWKMMLPGDYIAMRLTGEVCTTPGGLSEGILWDFKNEKPARLLLNHYGIDPELLPDLHPAFSRQGQLSRPAAEATGLVPGIPVTYRAGDQPNNAMSLNVLNPGEVAATAGTSGVVYGVVDRPEYDPQSRVNGFVHVNHTSEHPRIGILLCINGAGIQYAWVKYQLGLQDVSYPEMEHLAASVPVGSDGLQVLPFGNGAERMLLNQNIGASILNLHFNRHTRAHIYRATLEGIAFAFACGIGILNEMGLNIQVMRAGNDNLFRSRIFSGTLSNLMNGRIELIRTTGAAGAAKAAGMETGVYGSLSEAMKGIEQTVVFEPDNKEAACRGAYERWKENLNKTMC